MSVHLAISVEGLDAMRVMLEDSAMNFAHCATDDWNVAAVCARATSTAAAR